MWAEECVCLLIKQQQDMCVRVHSPRFAPCVRPKPDDNSSKLRYNSPLNADWDREGAGLCIACDDKALCIILPLSHLPDGVLTNGDDS